MSGSSGLSLAQIVSLMRALSQQGPGGQTFGGGASPDQFVNPQQGQQQLAPSGGLANQQIQQMTQGLPSTAQASQAWPMGSLTPQQIHQISQGLPATNSTVASNPAISQRSDGRGMQGAGLQAPNFPNSMSGGPTQPATPMGVLGPMQPPNAGPALPSYAPLGAAAQPNYPMPGQPTTTIQPSYGNPFLMPPQQ